MDTDTLALISDCPFLVCVFYVPFNEMISLWQRKKENYVRNEKSARNFSKNFYTLYASDHGYS